MKMKKIISDKILRDKMSLAVDTLCNTVKTTLGPKGSNVIIDHSSFTPFITNDGVTIASNIESDDEVVNTILQLAKESSIKTNETVGDGTTTTLVLLQAIYHLGLKCLKEGLNPIILKKELNETLLKIISKIKKKSHLPNKEELVNIASISANSKEIGEIVGDAYLKVKNKNAISIKEGSEQNTKVIFQKGYILDSILASEYLLKDKKEIDIINACVLTTNNYLNEIEEIAIIINYLIDNKKDLIIFADDYSNAFVNEIIAINLQNNLNIYLLKTPEFGKNKYIVLDDISLITNSQIEESNFKIEDLGNASNVKLNKDKIIISFENNKNIKEKIRDIKENAFKRNDDFDKLFAEKRLAMLNNGLIEILVGAKTDTECREKKMRYDDALWAISVASNGIVPGCGLILYQIADDIKIKSNGDKIFKEALKYPFNQIMNNSGLESENINEEIKKFNYQKIYNINNNTFEDINDTCVLDPTDVLINSLNNATSIASMLLTTTSIIINEYKNDLNKINDYNEL